MATKKPASMKPKPVQLNIDVDDDEVELHLSKDGKPTGEIIKDTVVSLHRLMLEAQMSVDDNEEDPGAYIPIYAGLLSKKYQVNCTNSAAYRIAESICRLFAEQKKSLTG